MSQNAEIYKAGSERNNSPKPTATLKLNGLPAFPEDTMPISPFS